MDPSLELNLQCDMYACRHSDSNKWPVSIPTDLLISMKSSFRSFGIDEAIEY